MISLLRNLGLALAAFALIASCGNNAAPAAAAPAADATDSSSTGIARAADGDIDGLIVEYGELTKALSTVSEKAAAGDVAAATEASNYSTRMLEITTALSAVTLTPEQTQKYAEAAAAGSTMGQ